MLGSFASWYSGPLDGFTASVTGWHSGAVGKLVFFAGLAVLLLLALRAAGLGLPPSIPTGVVVAALGAFGTILVLVRLIDVPDRFAPVTGRSVGVWISLGAALLLIVAGLLQTADDA